MKHKRFISGEKDVSNRKSDSLHDGHAAVSVGAGGLRAGAV